MTSRVSWVVRVANPSIGTIRPLTRAAGGKPGVRWTSEAPASTMRMTTAEKSKLMVSRSSARAFDWIPETDDPGSRTQAVTLRTSPRLVIPARTLVRPSSRRVSMPSSRATTAISASGAWLTVISLIRSLIAITE